MRSKFAPHMEGSNADFAPHFEQRHCFKDQKMAKIAISANFQTELFLTHIFVMRLYDSRDIFFLQINLLRESTLNVFTFLYLNTTATSL